MIVNYRKRCIVEGGTEYPYDVIYYGLSAAEMSGARDLGSPWTKDTGRGRTRNYGGDDGKNRDRHFFTKNLSREAIDVGLQGGPDPLRVGARYTGSSVGCAAKAEVDQGGPGGGDRGAGSEEDNQKEVTT